MARPQFDFESDSPYIDIRKGYHPLLISGHAKLAKTATKFVPNDTVFGKVDESSNEPLVILLTGPNMGGKSTLMVCSFDSMNLCYCIFYSVKLLFFLFWHK